MVIVVVILLIFIYLLNKSFNIGFNIETFWMPGTPKTPFGTPLEVPYRYTTLNSIPLGDSANRLLQHNGLPTIEDYLRSISYPFNRKYVHQKPIGIGVDITQRESGRYIDPRLLGPQKWDFYKFNEFNT